jgi:hypothetical protein
MVVDDPEAGAMVVVGAGGMLPVTGVCFFTELEQAVSVTAPSTATTARATACNRGVRVMP